MDNNPASSDGASRVSLDSFPPQEVTAVPQPMRLTEEDRLSVENIYLKLQNCQLQVQTLDAQKNQIILGMRELQQEMEKKRAELSEKYGVDIGRHTVRPDGTIVPNPKG